jgi:hypothetical protein
VRAAFNCGKRSINHVKVGFVRIWERQIFLSGRKLEYFLSISLRQNATFCAHPALIIPVRYVHCVDKYTAFALPQPIGETLPVEIG